MTISNKVSDAAWAAPRGQEPLAFAPQKLNRPDVRQFALDLANRDRVADGLPPMAEDLELSQAAQRHAEDMLRRNYFDHYSPEGESPADRLTAAGGSGFPAENIGMREDPRVKRIKAQLLETFQRQWMSSAPHRRNLMNPNYQRFGYGLAIDPGSGRVFAVQMFTRRS
ncbi:CAP domain-containing protein [Altericista sp. CCNU0014]|uniref:CAP domain-containing protein n=1 Tax=Altericista sp. CCNU0014 TaxID=3082949 RepID=UPI00384EBEA4